MGVVVGIDMGVVVGVDVVVGVGVVVVGIYAVVMGIDDIIDVVLVATVMDVVLSQNMEMFVGEMKSSLLPPIKTAF